MSRFLMLVVLPAVIACGKGNSDSCDTAADDTANACVPGGGGPTTPTNPTNVGNTAPVEGNGTVSNGEVFTFKANTVTGEHDGTKFTFAAIGATITNTLAVGVQTGSGPGTYTITDPDGTGPSTYTDFTWGLPNGGFVSTGGTLTITGWEANASPVANHLATGTFNIQYTNSPDPASPAPIPLTLTLEGTFTEITLIDAS